MLVAAAAAIAIATFRPRVGPLAIAGLAAIVPLGALVGTARLAAIDDSPLRPEVGHRVEIVGYVTRRERVSFGVRRVRVAAIAHRSGPGMPWVRLEERVQVRSRGATLGRVTIGDEVRATGKLAPPRPGKGGFDYAAYLRRAGVQTVLHADRAFPTGRRRAGVAGTLDAVRRRAERGVRAGLPAPMAALARGMVLGADEDIPPRMTEDFQRSGLAHVLAVSGQNVALLAALAWAVMGAAGAGRRGRLVGIVLLIALYVPLTGAGPSIQRAGVMGVAATVAALAGRPASRWYALLLAAAVTMGLDPRAWQDTGWQLSFAAVVGIFVLARPLGAALRPLPEPVRTGAALTIAATIATGPLMAYQFDRVSLAALPANLAALPAIPLVMWTGTLSAAVAQVWIAPAELLNALNGVFLAYVAAVARWCAGLPAAAVGVQVAGTGQLALIYAAMAAALAAPWRARGALRRRSAAPAACVVLAAGAGLLVHDRSPEPPRDFAVTFLDVGQGDATLVQAPGGFAALVDGGPPEADVASKLRARGVTRLQLMVLTHAQQDHEGGLEGVLARFPVEVLLDGGHPSDGADHHRIVGLARARGVRVIPAGAGQRFRLGPRLRLDVLAPRSASDPPHGLDPNLRAIVLHVAYRGLDVLLPADAESDVTAALPLTQVEVLKVAHHGSEDEGTRALLGRLRPVAAVIPVGAHNRYGHPHPATVAALRARVPRVFRTDRDGNVTVTLGTGGPAISSER